MKLSKSKVLCYCDCPLKFKFEYIEEREKCPNKYMIRGVNLHKIFENFFKEIRPDMTEKDFLPLLEMLAGENLVEYKIYLEKFAKIQTRRFKEEKYFHPILREVEVEAKIDHIDIHGFIDVIEQVGEDQFIVADYKTSEIYKIDEYMFELCMYALMAKEGLKMNIVGVKLYALKNGKELTAKIGDADLIHAKEIIHKVYKKIEAGEFFKQQNKFCFFCSFMKECQEMI